MRRKQNAFAIGLIFCGLVFASPAGAKENLWVESKDSAPLVELTLPSFAPIIDKLGNSVVNISTEGTRNAGRPVDPLEFFFGNPPGSGGKQQKTFSLGSGFVISPNGYIVTNNHVVERATKIYVRFKDDKRRYEAKTVGSDPKTDIALIKVDIDKKLEPVVFGDSENLVPGDWVIAIGNPFKLGHTATVGIVSAKSRRVGGPYDDYIQTDASINPGNSGGPLFNAKGEVIGVNTAIFSPGALGNAGFNIGIGFAIPINLVKNILTQLHEHGSVVRGWLGVLIQPISPDVAEALDLDGTEGSLVADVIPGSPAAKAGFQRGDVIVSFGGTKVEENDELPLMVAETKVGTSVRVEVVRAGKRKVIDVEIEELKEEAKLAADAPDESAKLGLSVQELTPEIARSLGSDSVKGIVVTAVSPDGAAAAAGMQRGDIILEMGGEAVVSVESFNEKVKALEENKPVLLLVRRGENTVFLTLRLE